MNSKEKRKLLKLCEENNQKSPEVISAVITVNDRMDAVVAAEHYFDIVRDYMEPTPPFKNYDAWGKSLKLPVELYFVFKRRRDLGRFVRKMSQELHGVEVII